MKQQLKKIYTILILIKNILIRKRNYTLHFIAEVTPPFKRWYYDFKHYGFDHANLEMVSGADELCELYANGNNEVTVKIKCSNKPLYYTQNLCDEFIAMEIPNKTSFLDDYLWGREYKCNNFGGNGEKKKIWICPVTLFVLGRYPKYLYIIKPLKNIK